jgi:hypothetical protein
MDAVDGEGAGQKAIHRLHPAKHIYKGRACCFRDVFNNLVEFQNASRVDNPLALQRDRGDFGDV